MRLGKYGKILHYDKTALGIGQIQRFTLFELKNIGGIIINLFNTQTQDRYHSHAFAAWSWMIKGFYFEDVWLNGKATTKRISKSRFIPKDYTHKITYSAPNTISITFEGPWDYQWAEYFDDGRVKIYTWGRKVLKDTKYET